MVDVKLGDQIYKDVEAVKLNTPDGGAALFHEQDYLPWEILPNSGTDLLGAYTEAKANYTPNVNKTAGYIKLKEDYGKVLLYTGNYTGLSLDLTAFRSETRTLKAGVIDTISLSTGTYPSRLILPERYPGFVFSSSSVRSYPMSGSIPVTVYLSKTLDLPGQTAPDVSWMGSTMSANITEQIAKCPKDTDIPYYLNKMTKLTAESLVGILENLKDISGEVTAKTLTLGTANLEKLTEEQLDIARQKGWSLA